MKMTSSWRLICHRGSSCVILRVSNNWLQSGCSFLLQVSKQLSEEYEKLVNPEKAAEDLKPLKIKEEPVSDITFPMSEELEGDLASGDQSLPVGVLGAQSERFSSNMETEASPQTSGTYYFIFIYFLQTYLASITTISKYSMFLIYSKKRKTINTMGKIPHLSYRIKEQKSTILYKTE